MISSFLSHFSRYNEKMQIIRNYKRENDSTYRIFLMITLFYQVFIIYGITELCSGPKSNDVSIYIYIVVIGILNILLLFIFTGKTGKKLSLAGKNIFCTFFFMVMTFSSFEIMVINDVEIAYMAIMRTHLMFMVLSYSLLIDQNFFTINGIISSWCYLIVRTYVLLGNLLYLEIILLFGVALIIYAVNMDILTRANKIEKVKKSKTIYKTSLNMLPESICIFDSNLQLSYFNHKFLAEFGNDNERIFNMILSKESPYNDGDMAKSEDYIPSFEEISQYEKARTDSINEDYSVMASPVTKTKKSPKRPKLKNFMVKGMRFSEFVSKLSKLSVEVDNFFEDRNDILEKEAKFLKNLKKSLRKGFLFNDPFDETLFYETKFTLMRIEGESCILLKTRKIHRVEEEQNDGSFEEIQNFQSKFLSSISHELRTPVNGAISLLQQVKESLPQDIYRSLVKPPICSLKIMVFTISDIVDYSSVLRNNLNLKMDSIDLVKIMKKIHSLIKIQTEIRNLSVSIDLSSDIPSMMVNDAHRICQVLLNLLTNAIKFTNSGFIKIILEKNIEKNAVEVRVEDSGIGMKPETIHHLFKLNHKSTGMIGLGLTISNLIAEKLNKFNEGIHVRSEISKGSSFWFFLSDYSDMAVNVGTYEELNFSSIGEKTFTKKSKTEKKDINLMSLNPKSAQSLFKSESHKAEDHKSIEIERRNDMQHLNLPVNRQPELVKAQTYNTLPKSYTKLVSMPNVSKLEVSKCHSWSDRNKMNFSQDNLLDVKEKVKMFNSEEKVIESDCDCPQFLLVDDNDFNLYALEISLKRFKAICDKVVNGKEACEQVKRLFMNSVCCTHYKIIFMDIDMPIMNGYEATRFLKKYFKENGMKTKILACTAFVEEEDVKKCFKAGCDGYLSKPITNEVIEETLTLWFNN